MLGDKSISHGMSRALRHLRKELLLYRNHVEGLERWTGSRGELNDLNVQIGGGAHLLDGYLNIDIVPPADLICDVREGLPLPNSCSNVVFSEHFLEHIDYPVSAKKFIFECHRILKRGGQLIIGVPDSELAVMSYVKRNKNFYKLAIRSWYSKRNCLKDFNTYIDLLNYHFRDQDDDKKYNPHFWAYDYEKIVDMMRRSGFVKIRRWKFDNRIANSKRKWGSIYVCGEK